ncbi:uncharacterized protein LOC121375070 [Gigantopelta aegis]|uniref:uncharacterized protein LOC121375070 n=1 Tax=Gigantopelta aegis TaxID=1735272 RepID=UPI001B88A435|nr:uncharacterized protein LOC121375070 [Gigantopelta aegis]XP_041358230.1 uncharacterized protein LOC121375070 [Gigantopelta aegis]XP_041358231.1 uncharacterized protein LOC121375070 [Gigantopelta aegis]
MYLLSTMKKQSYGIFVYFFICVALLALLVFQVYFCRYKYQLRNPYLLESMSKQSSMLYGSLAKNVLKSSLVADKPVVVVHYLWCRKGHFEFKHFISILSIFKTIRPDKIVFHYSELPVKDDQGFVTWFADIQRDIPSLVLKYVANKRFCGHRYFESSHFDLGDYHNPTGIFISDDIAVSGFTRESYYGYQNRDKCFGNSSSHEGYTCYPNDLKMVFLFPASEPAVVSESSRTLVINCPTIRDYNIQSGSQSLECVQVTDRIFPRDIWRPNDRFSSFARLLVYGSEEPVVPKPSDTNRIPLHAHILHFEKGGTIGYTAYASILSSIHVAGMKHVFLHADEEPTGSTWEDLQRYNVTFVPVRFLDEWHSEHADLMYGLYILMHYGGVLFRSNTVWRKPIPPLLLSFSTLTTLRRSVYRIINPSTDLNLLMSRKHAPYIQTLLAELRQTPAKHRRYKIEDIAYRMYQTVPASVDVEPNLIQHAKCKELACQATAEDAGASGSYAVLMDWGKDDELVTRDQVDHSRGPGTDVVKNMLNLNNRS